MAIRSSFCTPAAISLVALLVVTSTACQTQSKSGQTSRAGDLEVDAPVVAPGRPVPDRIEEPEPPKREEPKRVAVILGPGGAKAFAHVGVLKALQQQRVPIEKVIGLEWGALIGGLYAVKGQVHDVEWKLYKLEQQNVLENKKTGFFSRRPEPATVAALDSFLQEAFQKDDAARIKVPFACPSRSVWSGVVAWQNRGPLRDLMKRCLPYPPTFKTNGTFLAGASQATEAVELLAREGFNVIILVNVLGSAIPVAQDSLPENMVHVILWQEVKRAVAETSRLNIETVTVDTSAFPMNQFSAKKDLVSLGESAGQKAAAALISKYGF